LLRTAAAGIRADAPLTVSVLHPLVEPVQTYLNASGAQIYVETPEQWAARAVRLAAAGGRVRLLGASALNLAQAIGGSPALAVYCGEVVSAGRVELLTFLREQAISITTHRFGRPTPNQTAALTGGIRQTNSVQDGEKVGGLQL
jgi:RHH-type proline utilization regulon transcriptional repressor/proline dehydrogenase/delta 1-pyrroline-5-carboxylate dehydrogenase